MYNSELQLEKSRTELSEVLVEFHFEARFRHPIIHTQVKSISKSQTSHSSWDEGVFQSFSWIILKVDLILIVFYPLKLNLNSQISPWWKYETFFDLDLIC